MTESHRVVLDAVPGIEESVLGIRSERFDCPESQVDFTLILRTWKGWGNKVRDKMEVGSTLTGTVSAVSMMTLVGVDILRVFGGGVMLGVIGATRTFEGVAFMIMVGIWLVDCYPDVSGGKLYRSLELTCRWLG